MPLELRGLQLRGGRLVDDDRDVRMEPEDRRGTPRGERSLDGRRDGLRLVMARDYKRNKLGDVATGGDLVLAVSDSHSLFAI
jgi:hypothetical protein